MLRIEQTDAIILCSCSCLFSSFIALHKELLHSEQTRVQYSTLDIIVSTDFNQCRDIYLPSAIVSQTHALTLGAASKTAHQQRMGNLQRKVLSRAHAYVQASAKAYVCLIENSNVTGYQRREVFFLLA